MKHYVIVADIFDEYGIQHKHVEVIRETLGEAICEIETTKYGDPLVEKFMKKEIFYGEYVSGTRRFMFTFETTGGKQISYIVHEIEENSITRNAIDNGIYRDDFKLLEELL